MKSIKEIKNLSGKRVIIRVDFNVPMKDGKVLDDFRIKKSFPTILYLQKKGAKIVLISHLGKDGWESLLPIANIVKKNIKKFEFLKYPILSDVVEDKIKSLKNGEVVLLENLRSEQGEEKNSPSFARALSRYGDIFVNDAFSVSHREHASVVGIVRHLPSYAGFQLEEEVKNLSQAFDPSHPFLFILGGAKFETKIPLIKKFMKKADNIFIGGAIANDFLKARGFLVGDSLVSENILQVKPVLKQKNLILPKDVWVLSGGKKILRKVNEVKPGEIIVDCGTETIKEISTLIKQAKFVLWNGPLGKYEGGFGGSTEELIKVIAQSKIKNIVGGGDTVAIISKLKIEKKLGFVSTGGGATLDFLSKGTLPGIRVLK